MPGDAEPQLVAPVTGDATPAEPEPAPTVEPQGTPTPEVAAEPAPATELPPAPARRTPRRPTAIAALDLALPGVRSAEIRAELDRSQRQAKPLLAERERVIAAMDEIEAAMDAIGE